MVFFVQITLNFAWPLIFFVGHQLLGVSFVGSHSQYQLLFVTSERKINRAFRNSVTEIKRKGVMFGPIVKTKVSPESQVFLVTLLESSRFTRNA
jgi:hypothetical protein